MKNRTFWLQQEMIKQPVTIMQINLGNRCNQACTHCHIQASPEGSHNMDRKTAEKIMHKLIASDIKDIEFTGGAPELNINLPWFIEELAKNNKNITVRTNLTALDMPEHGFYFELYRKCRVKIIASLPCYLQENVDRQRGAGIYQRSIAVLKKLNTRGYGSDGLTLDLVYNPSGDFLPPEQHLLQCDYTQFLKEHYGVTFNTVIPITNAPVGRFREILRKEKKLKHYRELLRKSHNPATMDKLMCKTLVSINYQGYVYDCDFNLALNRSVKGYENVRFWEIDLVGFTPEITFDEHCYACTAGHGSSCYGALVKEGNAGAVNDAACC
jgi:radical SAM/Cys-rich protein